MKIFLTKVIPLTYYYHMTNEDLFKPLESKRAFEAIAEHIKNLVYSGHLKPGDKLPSERELAQLFKTGRMLIRESLRTLEQSGFIFVKKGREGGIFVKNVGADVITGSIADMVKLGKISLDDLTETRLEVELSIIGLAIDRLDSSDLKKLRDNIEYTEKLVEEGRISRDGNMMFHLILAKASRNYLLEMIAESVMNVVDSFVRLLKPDITHSMKILNDHKRFYEALEKRDVGLARELMREHILDVKKNLSTLAGILAERQQPRSSESLPFKQGSAK
ncbi:MAG: HTH-type transcriptional regulator LutR [Syntrophorhabdus sp. PtaU1.Bin050]|nr:MAG: HTH-type transcriptional regulator LutR [Syntrophorhabdus sp. PtaU1.Bin050]